MSNGSNGEWGDVEANFIAMDLGDGTTCIGTAELESGETQGILTPPVIRDLGEAGTKMIPTAYALRTDGGEAIGYDAIIAAGNQADLSISMKHAPSGLTNGQGKALGRFSALLLDTLVHKSGQVSPLDESELVVGCPSGWGDSEVRLYTNLLSEHLSRPVRAIRESEAALAFMRRDPNSSITPEQIEQGVLLLDFGSSTLDWTYLQGNGTKSINDGLALGARTIETFLFEQACKQNKLSPDDEMVKANRSWLIFQCRLVKEEFFKHSVFGAPDKYARVSLSGPDGAKIRFEIDLSSEILDRLLRKPFRLKDGGTALGWQEHLEKILERTRDEIARWTGRSISSVLLAGGACRMPFLLSSLKRVFGENIHCNLSPEPDYCVARGLAIAARDKLRWIEELPPPPPPPPPPGWREQCIKEAALVASQAITNGLPELIQTIANEISWLAAHGSVFPVLRGWGEEYAEPLKKIERQLHSGVHRALGGDTVRQEVQVSFDNWLRTLIGSWVDPCLDNSMMKRGYQRTRTSSETINTTECSTQSSSNERNWQELVDTSNISGEVRRLALELTGQVLKPYTVSQRWMSIAAAIAGVGGFGALAAAGLPSVLPFIFLIAPGVLVWVIAHRRRQKILALFKRNEDRLMLKISKAVNKELVKNDHFLTQLRTEAIKQARSHIESEINKAKRIIAS